LAIYGSGSGGGVEEGDTPVRDKSALVEQLKQAIAETTAYCVEHKIDLDVIQAAKGFERVKLLDDAVDAILVDDESKRHYLMLAGTVNRFYKAILPDPSAKELSPKCNLFDVIVQKVHSIKPPVDISDVMREVEKLLDESVAAQPYMIRKSKVPRIKDLSKIDFEMLKAKFERLRKRTVVEKLKGVIGRKLNQMIRLNRLRMDYLEHFRKMIDEYNAGSMNIDEFFKQLVDFAQSLNEEENRHIAAQLSEEELALFDLLIKPKMELSKQERRRVKKVARELLETLKREKLVLDWRKRQQSRAAVRLTIEETLDKLPQCYPQQLYRRKCDIVYEHIYESYYGQGQSVYSIAV